MPTNETDGMVKSNGAGSRRGPVIYASDPWLPGGPSQKAPRQLLNESERARLTAISSIVCFKKGELIYREGDSAAAAFNIIRGVVTTYASDGHIAAFLHPGDLFGLSEEGRYINTAKATTAVEAYRLPVAPLRRILLSDADVDSHVIVKLCHELRQAQRHALLLAQKRAAARLAMFLNLQEHLQAARGESTAEIYLPMNRSTIAEYIGLSLATLSRTFGSLAARGAIAARDLHHVKILDRAAIRKLASLGKGKRGA